VLGRTASICFSTALSIYSAATRSFGDKPFSKRWAVLATLDVPGLATYWVGGAGAATILLVSITSAYFFATVSNSFNSAPTVESSLSALSVWFNLFILCFIWFYFIASSSFFSVSTPAPSSSSSSWIKLWVGLFFAIAFLIGFFALNVEFNLWITAFCFGFYFTTFFMIFVFGFEIWVLLDAFFFSNFSSAYFTSYLLFIFSTSLGLSSTFFSSYLGLISYLGLSTVLTSAFTSGFFSSYLFSGLFSSSFLLTNGLIKVSVIVFHNSFSVR